MKLFISWSGERSQILAQALREWLPLVLHFVEPWLSQSDIDAGERWALQVSKELEASNFGIICITRENISSAWILFEAGALAKSMQQGRVIPLLLDIEFKDITGPLSQFQAKKAEKSGICELVESINRLHEGAVPDLRLTQLFEMAWPTLEGKIRSIPDVQVSVKHHRPQQDILEELVQSIRGLELRFRDAIQESAPQLKTRRHLSPAIFKYGSRLSSIMKHAPIQYVIFTSYFRDDFPWIYELGLDAYRAALDDNNPQEALEARRRLLTSLRMLQHSESLKELIGDEKDAHTVGRDMERVMEVYSAIEKASLTKERVAQESTPVSNRSIGRDSAGPPPDFDDEIPF